MEKIVEKLNSVKEKILLDKRQKIRFFGLIERNDYKSKWDILFSADWHTKINGEADLVYFIDKLKEEFDGDLRFLMSIVVASPDEFFIKEFMRATSTKGCELLGEISDLYISKDFTVKKFFLIALDLDGIDLGVVGKNEGPVAVGEITEF
jgi:hypothetical protein